MKQKVKRVLSIWAAFSTSAMLMTLFFIEIPVGNKELFNSLFSMYMAGSIILVYSYYFGDSDSNERET